METCFEYLTNNDWGTFSTDEAKWVRRIKALQQDYPDQVEITAINKDGSIVARFAQELVQGSAASEARHVRRATRGVGRKNAVNPSAEITGLLTRLIFFSYNLNSWTNLRRSYA